MWSGVSVSSTKSKIDSKVCFVFNKTSIRVIRLELNNYVKFVTLCELCKCRGRVGLVKLI